MLFPTASTLSFQPNERIAEAIEHGRAVKDRFDYRQALTCIDLYDLIIYHLTEKQRHPSMAKLAKDRSSTANAIKRNAELLEDMGWLTFSSVEGEGTEWVITGNAPPDRTLRTPSTMTGAPVTATGVTPSTVTGGTYVTATGGTPSTVTSHKGTLKGTKQNGQEENGQNNQTEEQQPTSLEKETIQLWNDLKPLGWKSISSISPPRARTIKALGGYRAFNDQLPAFFAGVKSNPFWSKKPMSFENVMGRGAVPKSHFTELSEAGLDSNSNTTPNSLEHPDFFPPTDPWSELRPKHHGFTDDDDRDRREVEARNFYAAQEASK